MFDFLVKLSHRKDLRGQVYQQVRSAILDGRIVAGTALPSTRIMMRQLNVSRGTIVDAYERLINEDLAVGRVGLGTFVSDSVKPDWIQRPQIKSGKSIQLGKFWRKPPDFRWSRAHRYDFRIGVPENRLFPIDVWRRISAKQLRTLSRLPNPYGPAEGELALREEVAQHVSLTRAVHCTADEIIITNGAQQAVDLIARIMVQRGTVVAVEEPGYLPARNMFASYGAKLVGVPVDREGLRADKLPANARLVYTTPSHQFPLGVPLSLARRNRLIQWASARGAVIVEDDYDSDFRFEGRPVVSLQSIDRAGVVLYVGTFSKTLAPGLRLGFLVAPPALREALIAAKRLCDWHSASLPQLVLAEFMASGGYAKYIAKLGREYTIRRRLLLSLIEERCSGWLRPFPSVAGLHIAAELSQGFRSGPLVKFARSQDVGLYDVAPFWIGKPEFDAVMLGFGAASLSAIASGIRRLGRFSTVSLRGMSARSLAQPGRHAGS